jgi:hypothetical protein
MQREAIQDFTKGIAHSPKNKLRALRKILKNADEYVAHSKLAWQLDNTDSPSSGLNGSGID